ncbi:ABC transporter permease [Rhodobacter ferrooxidans]|uniref:ABC transporter permease n=1 Tax=Rhodobacter ferrooxidans TaxID=371731 RepID=UPI000303C00E|nr:FtsX-like permease family protein [Rhodobacter sp. SW2]
MSALNRKLLHDLVRIWAQTLAIAGVLGCGIMVLVMGTGVQRSLTETRAAYYERNRFAEVFVQATRAPRSLLPEIAALEGVALAEVRVVLSAVLDLDGMAEPATARILSLPASGNPVLNVPLLRSGRMPDPLHADEVVVAEAFAMANALHPGDRFRAVIEGQSRELVITGTVISPEFIYTIAPASMMPDDKHFALIWMGETAAAAAADLGGAFNDLSLTLGRGANEKSVIAALDRLLAPYGGTGAYGRDRQSSHAFLDNELAQLAAIAKYLPPVFLVISAFLVNMVLGRLIALDRPQIGLLKAVGYSTGAIAAHYLKLSIGIGLVGVAVGWGVGWWLGAGMTRMYADFFRFPFLIYVPGVGSFVISGLLGLATVLLGALRAVLASARLAPAVAMAPPAPPAFRRGWVDWLGDALHLRNLTMMILRSVSHWPGRAMVTLFGVAASVSVLVASFFILDVMAVLMTDIFEHTNRQQATLMLSRAQGEEAVLAAAALPGVRRAEGAFVLPVRVGHGTVSRLLALQARAADTQLTRILDTQGRPFDLPQRGLAIPESLADVLGVRPGDTVTVELLAPPRETWVVPVTALVRQSMGQDVHMAAPALFALMRSPPQVNAIHLMIAPEALPGLRAAVKTTPAIGGMVEWTDIRRQFDVTMNENLVRMVVIYTALGMLITVGVVYNAARIQLAERAHELASLRVLGFTRREVGYVLVGELMLLSVLAVPVGWALGYGFAALMVAAFSSEMVSMPLVISRATYAYATLVVLGTALAAALLVRRRLDHTDLVSALKQRE